MSSTGLRIWPAILHRGATLAVVSPASAANPDRVRQGVERLEALGYKVRMAPHALERGPLYYAGTREERVADLHAAFADAEIDGIVCTRGGWGSAELLPLLDVDLIRANPKAFVGYSDHTSLHCWMQNNTDLVTFYGPMVASDFGRDDGVDEVSWANALERRQGWGVGARDGLRVLRAGRAEGRLRGGCISILTQSLGTPYAAGTNDSVLFLEDVGTKPYQWDRMLLHLRYAGRLDTVRGVVFGDMGQCAGAEDMELLEAAILHALCDFEGPIAIGLRSGHVSAPNITLPLNAGVKLDLSDGGNPELRFVASGNGQ